MTRLLPASIVLLAFLLPFEVRKPVVSLPSMGFTDLELVALLVVALGAARAASARLGGLPPTRIAILALVVAALPILSALWAPAHRGASLKFALRMLTGVGVYFATWSCCARPGRTPCTGGGEEGESGDLRTSCLPGFVLALVAGAALSSTLGIWTCLDPEGASWLVPFFREREFLVGNTVRMSGTFEYPNIAAGFLALAFILSLSRPWGILWTAAQGVILTGLAMTLSRAGVVVGLLGFALVIAIHFLGEDGALSILARLRATLSPFLPALAVTTCCMAGMLVFYPPFALRFRSGGDEGWYRARYETFETVTLPANGASTVRVGVTNAGSILWTPGGRHPFRLSYHWYKTDSDGAIPGPQARTELPGPVRPGETLTLQARIVAPPTPGDYVLGWDMVHEHAAWFSQKGSPIGRVSCSVGPASGPLRGPPARAESPPDPGALEAESISRRALWHAGWRMFVANPLLGVGPDNFRRLWGREFGMDRWDERVHANSLYVELFSTTGLLGGLAFFGFLGALVARQVRTLRLTTRDGYRTMTAMLAFTAAVAAHGTVDGFLAFTPMYLLFWMVAGISVGLSGQAERRAG